MPLWGLKKTFIPEFRPQLYQITPFGLEQATDIYARLFLHKY